MKRFIGAAILGLVTLISAQAHFVFIVPGQSSDSKKEVVLVVFSDTLAPDEKIDVAKFESTKLTMRDAAGKESALAAEKGKHELIAVLPGKGNRLVYGTTEMGVLQKGDSKPFLLKYYPKAIVGSSAEETATIGKAVPVEIVPAIKEGKIRFQVLINGKPAEGLEVTIMLPGDKKNEKTKTDKEGFAGTFEAKGRYGVWARHVESSAGESAGKKYEEVRNYATLVVEMK
jgi:uncharacterized GH25 family protein